MARKAKKKQGERPEKLRILAAGDLHGSTDIARKLSEKAKREKVDLVILAGDLHGPFQGGDVVAPFKKNHQKVIFVPGNWDSGLEIDAIKNIHKDSAKNIDNYYVTYNDVGILGVGNKDFRLKLDEEKTFKGLEKTFKRAKPEKKILVSHMHASGTEAEFSGIEGSKALKKAIKEFKPDLFISAHIHEAEGIEEKIGKTKVIQVGRKGKVIEI